MRARGSYDLHHVAILNLRAERDHASVDTRAGAGVADFRVNHVREVHGRRAARQLDHLAHWREGVNVFRIQVELERVEEVLRVFYFLRPFDERAQSLKRLIVVARTAFPFLVFPVRGHAFLGHVIHLFGADLNFERLEVGSDHGSVKRLVQVVARSRDPIFDTTGNGFPVVMDHAERGVTMAHFVGRDDARCDQIVNLIETNLLRTQFFPDRIESFDAAFEEHERHFSFVHLLFDTRRHALEEGFVFRTTFFQLFGELAIVFRVQVAKREILELAAQFTHSEPMRDRREDLHRLFGDTLALLGVEVLKRAHVMQAVGEFDEDNAYVVDHRQQHLAHVLGLLFLARDVTDLRDLRETVDEVRYLFPEVTADRFEIDERVFDNIVQETRRD